MELTLFEVIVYVLKSLVEIFILSVTGIVELIQCLIYLIVDLVTCILNIFGLVPWLIPNCLVPLFYVLLAHYIIDYAYHHFNIRS